MFEHVSLKKRRKGMSCVAVFSIQTRAFFGLFRPGGDGGILPPLRVSEIIKARRNFVGA